uniref:GYF domain-containing protein n=2 Tax=Plectus sambesii TaxID=2011161 RepID=A0A914VCD0_9BILA
MESSMSSATSWYYQGEDGKVYGPASPEDMMCWYRAGYFDPHVLLGTDKEVRFYRLSEWIVACGQVPFLLPIKSMESAIMQRMNSVYGVITSQGQTCMSPLMLISQNGMVRQQHVPPGLHMPPPVHFPPPLSNDPADDGGRSTTSQTPDSDNWQAPESTPRRATALLDKDTDTADAPWLLANSSKDVDVQVTLATSDSAVQTEPIKVSALEACEALSRLFGTRIMIT